MFNPRSTSEFEALLVATLLLKNVKINDEYTCSIHLLVSQERLVEKESTNVTTALSVCVE